MSGKFYATSQGLTVQDRLKPIVMSKPFYDEATWNSRIAEGRIDTYMSALLNSDDINYNEFINRYGFEHGDRALIGDALESELFADKEKLKDYQMPSFDDKGNYVYDENGLQQFETVQMTEYDYINKTIKDANRVYAETVAYNKLIEEREKRNEFLKALGDTGTLLGQLWTSAWGSMEAGLALAFTGVQETALPVIMDVVDPALQMVGVDIFDLTDTKRPTEYSNYWKYILGDTTFAETYNHWYNEIGIHDEMQEEVDILAYSMSHIIDDKGNLTDFGKYSLMVADTVGAMLPSIALAYATGGAGNAMILGAQQAGNLTSATGSYLTSTTGSIGQLAYYGSAFGRSVSDQYEYYASQGISVSSSEIVANSLVKATLELVIERALGKIFGSTGMDRIWGMSPKNQLSISSKSLKGTAFGRLAKDALQESLEESLQETSGYLVDKVHHYINHNFQSDEWSWQNIIDAAIIAHIVSIGGSASQIIGTKRVTVGTLKTDKNGEIVKNKNGEYEFKKLGKLASWEFGYDLQAYGEAIKSIENANMEFVKLYESMSEDERKNSKKVQKAMSEYQAAYYQALASFEMISSVYGEMGKERFNKANAILTAIRENEDAGVFNNELRKKAQEALVNKIWYEDDEREGHLTPVDRLDRDARMSALIKAEVTRISKTVNKGDAVETELETKAAKFLNELENVDKVVISKDGKSPVLKDRVLIIPENLLKNASERVIFSTIAEQELADELAEGVLSKSKYLNNELGIVTDLYRQWSSNENATEQEAVYNLIFDPKFFEIVLALNERSTASFLLRLNKIVKISSRTKNFKDTMVLKRVDECRKRWTDAAYNYYSNNLDKDTSAFTDGLTSNEKTEFNNRISKLLVLYNMGSDIITKPDIVSDEVWSFIERRINNMNVDEKFKAELRSKIKSANMKERQEALDNINEAYDGAFNTLYNGQIYMPLNSIGNYAFNNWLQNNGFTLKTFLNSDYFTENDLNVLGNNYTLNDVIALRDLQFNTVYPNMSLKINDSGNVIVIVDGDESGFDAYANIYNQNRSDIVTGKTFKLGDKEVERKIVTDLSSISKWIKTYLKSDLIKSGVHEFITIDEFLNHSEYLNPAVSEDILNTYGTLNKLTMFRYFQKELCSNTDGKQSLILKQDGTVVIGDMTAMQSTLVDNVKFPKDGTFSIKNFVKAKYLSGTLANVKVVFKKGVDTRYVDYERDGDAYKFVNTIYIDTALYTNAADLSFALCHEFQHAIQTENRLGLGTSTKILEYFSESDRKSIIKLVKKLEPKLFVNAKTEADVYNNVNRYIYHASGEFQAMGLGGYGMIGFYPVIISHKNGKTKVTFRDGTSFETQRRTNGIVASRDIYDQSKDLMDNVYSKFNLPRIPPAMYGPQRTRYKELLKIKRIDITQDEQLEMMSINLFSSLPLEKFKETQVLGIEIDGEKYVIGNVGILGSTLEEITKGKTYQGDILQFKIFTFMPKDVSIYRPSYGSTFGSIAINDSRLTNVRNVPIDFNKKAEVVTPQNLAYDVESIFTGEILNGVEDLKDLAPDLWDIMEKYMSKTDGVYGDFVLLTTQLYELMKGTTIATGMYNYACSTSTEIDGTNYFSETNNFSVDERRELVDDIMSHPTYRTKMFEIWRNNWGWKNGKIPSTKEFLNMEIPIIRIHNDNSPILNDSPFVSVAILDNDIMSINELTHWLQKRQAEYVGARLDAGENLGFDPIGVKGNLFYGSVKVKDVLTFVPSGLSELLVEPKYLTNKGISFESAMDDDYNLTLGYRLDVPTQELSPTDSFLIDETKEIPKSEKVKKPKKIAKVIDKRPKSERRGQFKYNSKKYSHYRTPLGESKNAIRVIGPKDIRKDVEQSDIDLARGKGGNYVYREFVERRYYIKSDKSEGYKDIFDYYSVKDQRRHSLKSEIEDTNLRYFTTKKGKSQITMSPQLREFVIASTDLELDPVIMKKIKNGNLKTDDLLCYVIDTPVDKTDNVTFRLILDKIYDNQHIKSKAHLMKLALDDSSKMVALYFVLKNTDFEYMLYKTLNDESLDEIWNFATSQSKFADELNRIYTGASFGLSHSLKTFDISKMKDYQELDAEILTKESLYKTIKFYKGDIATGSRALIKARKATFKNGLSVGEGYQASRFGELSKYSLNASIKGDSKVTFIDQVSSREDTPEVDDTFDYEYGEILNELMNVEDGIGKRVFKVLAEKIMSEHNNDYTFTKMSLGKYMVNLSQLSEEQVVALYQRLLDDLDSESLSKLYYLAELPGFEDVVIESEYTRKQNVKSTLNKVINYGSKVQGIKRRLNTIKKYVTTTNGKNILLSENSDILDDELNLKLDSYRNDKGYKSIEIINELSKRIAKISDAAKAGVYYDKERYNDYIRSVKNKSKQLDSIYKVITKKSRNHDVNFVNVSVDNGSISVKLNKSSEIPKAIRQILSVGLRKTGYNKVQELSTYHEKYNEDGSVDKVYDDKYLKLTMTHLLRENSELLNSLSEDEAVEILEFYANDNIILSDIDSQVVAETVRLTAAYLLGESRYSSERYGNGFERFNFDETLIKRVEAKMIDQAHLSAAMLSNQRTIIRLLQPNKVIGQEICRNLGFKLDDVDEQNLDVMLTQMRSGTKESYRNAKKVFEEKLIREYGDKSKQSIIDKLLTFERAMMLSNPGTWLRNASSNFIVEGGNKLSHKIGSAITDVTMKVFPKTKDKLDTYDGYKLDKKASDETNEFIKRKFEDSGVLNEIASGISKYDDWSEKNPISDDLVSATARAIHQNIRRNQVFNENGRFGKLSKFGNLAIKTVYKGLNDDPWVRRATIKYLGQILEEDYQKAKATAAKKGKDLTYEDFLKDDDSNVYGISKPIAEAFTKSVSLASYDYMKTSNFITRIERTIRENVPKGAWFMYKQVFPFLSSSWNWCVEGMRYTPAGLASSIIKLAKLENTINKMNKDYDYGKTPISGEFARYLQMRNLGKGAIGTLGFVIGCILAGLGVAGIDDEDGEYKLYVGDFKVDINEILGSQGVMLGIAIISNATDEDADFLDVLAEAFNQLFRDSIFQNFIDTFRWDTGVGNFGLDTLMDIPAQFWPSAIKSITSFHRLRGVEYSDNKIFAAFQRGILKNLPIPVAAVGANLPVNPYTGETESFFTGEFWTDVLTRFTPIKVKYPSVNKNEAIAIGLGVRKGELTGNYNIDGEKINLTSNEKIKLNTLYGKLNDKTLTRFYNNSLKVKVKTKDETHKELNYSQMSENEKRAAIDNLMSNNSSFAKIYILTSTGKYKYYASNSEYEELRKLGITKNVYRQTGNKKGFVKI